MAVKLGIIARLEAQDGKGDELREMLSRAREAAAAEAGTITWYAFKIDETHYGIFDTFNDSEGLAAHRGGEVPQLLAAAAGLYATPPVIETLDIWAVK